MVAPIIFASLSPPSTQLANLDTMFAWAVQFGCTPCLCAGTNALTLTPIAAGPAISSVISNQLFSFIAANNSTGLVTASVVGLTGTFPVYMPGGSQANAGDLQDNTCYLFAWNPVLPAGGGPGGYQIVGGGGGGGPYTTYTPAIAPLTGAFASIASAGRFKLLGKTCFLNVSLVITTNGTAGGYIQFSLPIGLAAVGQAQNLAGTIQTLAATPLTSLSCQIPATGTGLIVMKYDGTYPGANNTVLNITGSFEFA